MTKVRPGGRVFDIEYDDLFDVTYDDGLKEAAMRGALIRAAEGEPAIEEARSALLGRGAARRGAGRARGVSAAGHAVSPARFGRPHTPTRPFALRLASPIRLSVLLR